MHPEQQSHYEILGVKATSTTAEIRTAYRRLVLKHHPDHSHDPKSADVLMRVVSAYEVLSDSEQRKAYDALLAARDRDRRRVSQPQPPPAENPARTARPAPRQSTLTEELLRLTSLFSKSRYAEAEKLAFRILEKNPKEATPYGVLGDIARARGNLPLAINMYAHAVQADPRNRLYQQRYEELVKSETSVAVKTPTAAARQAAPFFGGAVCVVSCAYVALSKEAPMAPHLGLISTWTLGLVVMLFLCGVAAGASFSMAGLLDRFSSVSTTSLGKLSPSMALGTVAIVNFWAAGILYALVGISQNAFNFSTSRLVGAVAAIVCLASLAAAISDRLNPGQVLLWGGNLAYIGAICGWMVADSLGRDI